jgi:plastocyanin
MRRLLLALVAATCLTPAAAAPAATSATHTIRITRTSFSPKKLSIALGDRVTWRNTDTIAHQVVADNGAFASAILAPGKTFSFTFHDCCFYPYHDALHPKLKGSVTVKAPPPSLSLVLSPPFLRYSETVTLTAQVSTHAAGQTVTILATPYGGTAQTAATLTTDANGVVTYRTQPPLLTTYSARWGSRSSQKVVVQVRPKLTFLPERGRLHVRAYAARSLAGRSILLQRLSAFRQWVTVAKYTLGPASGRIFDRPRKPGRYRVYMSVNQAGVGYLDGWSGSQRIRRRR